MTRITRPCVYTVLFGGYEQLNEQPVAAASGMPFICLTDDRGLTSETWTIVQVEPAYAMDPIRSQRILKTCPHEVQALQAFDGSLYIDNTVVLRAPPEKLMASLPASSGMGLPLHSFRASVHDEFLEVARLGLDDQGRIFEQLNHYLATDGDMLTEAPYWTAILLRHHDDARVRRAMTQWRNHILRYSRRDQLSVNTALRAAGLQPDAWTVDNYASWFHHWPVARERDRFAGARSPLRSATPIASEWHQARLALQGAQDELRTARADLDALRTDAALSAQGLVARDAELAQARQTQASLAEQLESAALHGRALDARLARMEPLLADALAENRALTQLGAQLQQQAAQAQQHVEAVTNAFKNSTSWRITAPLRKLRELLR